MPQRRLVNTNILKLEYFISIRHENQILDAHISAWEEVLRTFGQSDAANCPRNAVGIDRNSPTSGNGSDAVDRRRGPKGPWRHVMANMASTVQSGEFSTGDIEAMADMLETPIKADTARSQMANYCNRAWIERVSAGRFRFTNSGLDVFLSLSENPDDETHPEGDREAVGLPLPPTLRRGSAQNTTLEATQTTNSTRELPLGGTENA